MAEISMPIPRADFQVDGLVVELMVLLLLLHGLEWF